MGRTCAAEPTGPVGDIERAVRKMLEKQLRARGIHDEDVLRAMAGVPRHRFVPGVSIEVAYSDGALPTADGQTISQPLIVALMSKRLRVSPGVKVLEIGSGSGYQTAILAHLGARVISVERNSGLAGRAHEMARTLGYGGLVRIVVADGSRGYPAEAPYDRILVTAAAPRLPPAYKEQLADGGRIVIPIGDREAQEMKVFDKRGNDWIETVHGGCRFVPLIGVDAWAS